MKNDLITIGASSPKCERQINDFYATEPKAMELLLKEEEFNNNVWECAVGQGHLANVLKANGYFVKCSDIINRGYEKTEVLDFLKCEDKFDGDIITNPPYKYALEFVKKALENVNQGKKVAMFLRLLFLESSKRKEFFKKDPPKIVYVCSARINCVKNGEFKKHPSSAVCYAWFVWEKGFKGDTVIKWIN